MTAVKRPIVNLIISGLCLWGLTLFVSVDDVIKLYGDMQLLPLIGAFALITASIVLSSLRFHGLMTSFQVYAPLRSAHRINILSQVFGLFALQTLGQMVFRSTYGGIFVNNPQRLAALTVLEKVVALSTLLVISLSGSFYITRHLAVTGGTGLAVVIVGAALLMSTVVVYSAAVSAGQRRFVRKMAGLLIRTRIRRTALISVVMHIMMLAAYVITAQALLPDLPWLMSAAIFSIVMLGAALPISFAGWGVRELSAGFMFSFLGLDPSAGILVSAMIGVVSLLALGGQAAIVGAIKAPTPSAPVGAVRNIGEVHFERGLAFFAGIAIAVLIGFQMRLPTDSGALTVNLADPVAFVAAITFLAIWYREYLHQPVWRVNGLAPALFIFAVLIIYGLAVGYWRLGFVDWAVFNRGLGVFVLLAYLFSGSMVAAFFGRKAVRVIVRAMVLSTLSILVLYVVAVGFLDRDVMIGLQWNKQQFNGLIGNRNALAFMLLMALSVALSIRTPILGRWRSTFVSLILFLLLVGGSRTGIATAAVVIALAMVLKHFSFKDLLRALAQAATLILLQYVVTLAINELDATVLSTTSTGAQVLSTTSTGTQVLSTTSTGAQVLAYADTELLSRVHADRVASYEWGLDMWLADPVFGAGMGAFITKYMTTFSFPLTIHNSGLWILAEMGVVGLALFLALPGAILAHIRKSMARANISIRELAWDDLALLLCLVVAVIFSQAHDILYQRILWFMIGILATNKLRLADTLSRRSHSSAY